VTVDENLEQRAARLRRDMVEDQIACRGIFDKRILHAFMMVPRHMFVPKEDMFTAYADRPVPIGSGQTISQPFIVAEMCRLGSLSGVERVLEVGTGSGYAAAILSYLAAEVYTIERINSLYHKALDVLQRLEYKNVHCIQGDGYNGYIKKAPFDFILLSAAPADIPEKIIRQLSIRGRIVAPVGREEQYLIQIRRTEKGLERSLHGAVRFVPMKHGFS